MLIGSCFSEHIFDYLQAAKFQACNNPNGNLFNPVSICSAIETYIENKQYHETDLFQFNELWHSWDHHSRFSDTQLEKTLEKINRSQQAAHNFLQKAQWLIITLGSAFTYELVDESFARQAIGAKPTIVANCHKVPANKFNKKLRSVEEILSELGNLLYRLQLFNPELKLIFTISPVRHLREGFVDNNRSKAILINAVQQLVEKFDGVYYFPAYELVIDDLRDYRFFAEDMVHPNYLATEYVWQAFEKACIHAGEHSFITEMEKLHAARGHKPLHPDTESFKTFLAAHQRKIAALQAQYPDVDFSTELAYFSGVSPGLD